MKVQRDDAARELRKAQWVLRVGVAGTFLGHGAYAWSVRSSWLVYLQTVGFSQETAAQVMPMIGLVDILVAAFALFWPLRFVFLWATLWALLAAGIRPLSGESGLEFIERASLWAAPLAYLYLAGFPKSWADFFKK